ncbi:MAG: glycosyltransferase [Aeriscardovia sp.]|nr:glycosyltransferase [Aeriscardovia sp.]
MTLQVLVATMNQNDHSLLEKMNIQSDAIVVNQCDHNEIESFSFNGHNVLWISLNERGIGLSRNTALMRASADIILFADDDVHYYDDYVQKIESAFMDNSKADMLLFDLDAIGDVKHTETPYKFRRVKWYNSLHYGAVHFACKRGPLFASGITYNLLFGGGAKYSCGEDSIFLANVLNSGFKVWTIPGSIGNVTHGESTWFKGYTDKYFYDKGVLMGTIFGIAAYLLVVALFLKNTEQTKDYGLMKAIRIAFNGVKQRKIG